MQSIILITDNNKILEKIEIQCRELNINSTVNSNKLNIEMKEGRLYISLSEEIVEDYDDAELEYIKKIFSKNRYFYLICYSSEKILKEILHILTFQDDIYIDDDQGYIVSLAIYKEFLI